MIKAFAAGSPQLAHADHYGTDLILVDAPTPGSGQGVRLGPGGRSARTACG